MNIEVFLFLPGKDASVDQALASGAGWVQGKEYGLSWPAWSGTHSCGCQFLS